MAIGRLAAASNAARALDYGIGGGGDRARRHERGARLARRRKRHVLRQIEMHRPARLAQRNPDRVGDRSPMWPA